MERKRVTTAGNTETEKQLWDEDEEQGGTDNGGANLNSSLYTGKISIALFNTDPSSGQLRVKCSWTPRTRLLWLCASARQLRPLTFSKHIRDTASKRAPEI